jgi:hypothetical protein
MSSKNAKDRKPFFDAHVFSTEARDALQYDLSKLYSRSEYHSKAGRLWVDKLLNKYCLPGDNLARSELAISKFLDVNDEMRICNTRLDHLSLDVVGKSFQVLMHARYLIELVLGPEVPIHELNDACRHSGGATIGVPRKDTSLEAKWSGPLTYCNAALPYITLLLGDDYELRSAVYGLNGLPSTMELPEAIASITKKVVGSRSTTVPKDNTIDRMIAVEPTINMFLQQGLAEVMWSRMRRWGLSLERDQEKHRKLACYGSVTNHLATIDFSSMSDRVSCSCIKLLFPREWYAAFMDVRSQQTQIGDAWVSCNMISSMGNATTFPIETLVLWALAVAVAEPSHNQKVIRDRTRTDIGVFGDDVILPSRNVPEFFDVVRLLGFVPNPQKSFFDDGYFRESCGGDFFHGRDVRPIHLKAFPSTRSKTQCEAHLYTMINRTIQKYISYFGPLTYVYDKALLRYYVQCLKQVTTKVKLVPRYFPEDAGICILHDAERFYREYIPPAFRSRVGVDIHGSLRFEYLSWTVAEKPRHDHIRYADWLRKYAKREKTLESPNIYYDHRVPVVELMSSEELRSYAISLNVQTETKRTTRESGKYVIAVSKLKTVDPRRRKPKQKHLSDAEIVQSQELALKRHHDAVQQVNDYWNELATTLTSVRGKVPS